MPTRHTETRREDLGRAVLHAEQKGVGLGAQGLSGISSACISEASGSALSIVSPDLPSSSLLGHAFLDSASSPCVALEVH